VQRDLNDELEWLALRYVTGELPLEEQESFETLLSEDQHAREAVDRVVELVAAVRLAAPAPVPSAGLRTRRATTGLAVWRALAAASLLVAAGIAWWMATDRGEGRGGDGGPTPVVKTAALNAQDSAALAWVALRREAGTETIDAELAPVWPATAVDASANDVDVGGDGDPELEPAVPDWLLTAFSDDADSSKETP
jgi:hypothetical protein